jgi:hypothetical protein
MHTCYNKQIFVETTICLKKIIWTIIHPSVITIKILKISENLQNDDEVGKLKNQELSIMPSNVKAKIDFGSTTYMMFIR